MQLTPNEENFRRYLKKHHPDKYDDMTYEQKLHIIEGNKEK